MSEPVRELPQASRPTPSLSGAVRSTLRLPANVADAWPGLDLEARRRILAVVVESMAVGSAVRGRTSFDPDRIAISWRV